MLFGVSQFTMYQVNIGSATGSMKPTMDAYDITVTDLTYDYDKVEKNDIILFDHNCKGSEMVDNKYLSKFAEYSIDTHVMHRVVADFEDEGLLTKGDNNNYIDQFSSSNCIDNITEDNFEGKLIYHLDAKPVHYIPPALILITTVSYLIITSVIPLFKKSINSSD